MPTSSTGTRPQPTRGEGSLVVITPLRAVVDPSGRVTLTRKFIDSMSQFAGSWHGPVSACLEPAAHVADELDYVHVAPATLPFEVRVMPFDSAEFLDSLPHAGIVQAVASYRQHHLARVLRERCVPCVYVTEYSLRTRLQQVRAVTPDLPRRLRRYVWELNQERATRRSLRLSCALQCNGVPTHEVYARVQADRLLFFASQASRTDLASDADLLCRQQHLLAGEPLRLAFWGRLIPMKGVRYLLPLARALRARGVPFQLTIIGDGWLRERLAMELRSDDLSSCVRLTGTLEFRSELVPYLRTQADLFVCCHPQGDPSCAYLEALAWGLPIAGFANEALVGLLRHADIGWTVPIGAVDALAEQIATLHRCRQLLVERLERARSFGRQHTTEATVERRLRHLRTVAQRPPRV